MSSENVALVQALLDASGRHDVEALMATLDPAIEWTPVEADLGYAVHRGHGDVRAWLTEQAAALPDMHWEADRVEDAGGETVVALVRKPGLRPASETDAATPDCGVIFTVRAGRIMRIAEYDDPNRALVKAGLAEQ
jgi:ketosteroid isomerase-like protein